MPLLTNLIVQMVHTLTIILWCYFVLGLTLREIEYLDFIKRKSMVIYGDVIKKLKQRHEANEMGKDFEHSKGFIA